MRHRPCRSLIMRRPRHDPLLRPSERFPPHDFFQLGHDPDQSARLPQPALPADGAGRAGRPGRDGRAAGRAGPGAGLSNLPALDALTDYRPKMTLRIFSSDGVLIGEFGEERRNLVRFKDIPDVMKKAVLAIEDDRFYEHGGVDYTGILRAALHNATGGARQGASTITQQVARNFFLSSEQTLKRKAYEALLAWKIEQNLSKDQILEVYMNQIYLGQRAYGFASAAQIYFGKNLKEISVAEAAMLASLPKAPSAYNPVVNPKRAITRQQYILQRMLELHYITQQQYEDAAKQPLVVKGAGREFSVHAEYVAEMVRQMMYTQYREEAYTLGLNVVTTIDSADQDAAYRAVRKGLMDYEHRHGYRGPEAYIDLPTDPDDREQAIEDALVDHPDNGEIVAAVVTEASPKQVKASFIDGNVAVVQGNDLRFVASALSTRAQPNQRIRPGAIVRLMKNDDDTWVITQLPQVEGAFVSIVPQDGAIRALVGGFDFNKNKFNHVTQAWRNRVRASSRSSIRHRWKKACRRRPSSTTRRCTSAPLKPVARHGSRRTTEAVSMARWPCVQR